MSSTAATTGRMKVERIGQSKHVMIALASGQCQSTLSQLQQKRTKDAQYGNSND